MNRIATRRKLALGCVVLSMAGCQSSGSREGFFSSPLQPGDEVAVVQPLTVAAERARVYLQHGRQSDYAGIDQYTPFCYFLLREPLPQAQRIEPGVWQIESQWLDETTVSLENPLRVAGLWLSVGAGTGRTPIAYQFHYRLGASPGREAMKLVCSGGFDDPGLAEPIRLAQIHQALGGYAEVRVKPEAGPTAR